MNHRKMLELALEIMTAQIEIIHTVLEANTSLVRLLEKNKINPTDKELSGKVIEAYGKYRRLGPLKEQLMKLANEKGEIEMLEEINANSARAILYFSMYFRENGIEVSPNIAALLRTNKKLVDAIAHTS